jgi:PhzF family phenazine biosynthesis protein
MIKLYQIDAFTDHLFGGNPAAVCPLEHWLKNEEMQKIAMENNLAETAFYVRKEATDFPELNLTGKFIYEIRWFTPTIEVELCGHATLATAFVLFTHENHPDQDIYFASQSGLLKVSRENDFLILNFPSDQIIEIEDNLPSVFNIQPAAFYKGKSDYLFVFENEDQIKQLIPDLAKIALLNCRGLIVTARGHQVDFVSRFFAPQSGIDEDPVTGSAHTTLIPYWAGVLKKDELNALQLSPRGGSLKCRYKGSRVEIGGKAKLYLKGEIFL